MSEATSTTPETPGEADVPAVTEHPALRAYRRRTRRAMITYGVVLAIVLLVTGLGVRLAYAHGELSHVSSVTGSAPPPLASGPVAASVSRAWQVDEASAGGTAYGNGIVVTWSAHTVNGRDALTGAVRWHYTRSDETLCGVVQQNASTIAVYRRGANCDEVTGLATATGRRTWLRTMMDDGTASLSSAPNIVLAVYPGSVHVIDNAGGLDRWRWTAPPGCVVDRALGGSIGVLTAYHCGSEHHLSLHALIDDSQKWDVGVDQAYLPISSGAVLGVGSTTSGELRQVSASNGALTTRLTPPPAVTTSQLRSAIGELAVSATTVEAPGPSNTVVEALRLGSVFALGSTARTLWSANALSQPVVGADNLVASIDTGGAVVLRDPVTGNADRTISSVSVPQGEPSAVLEVGGGLLVTGSTTTYYR